MRSDADLLTAILSYPNLLYTSKINTLYKKILNRRRAERMRSERGDVGLDDEKDEYRYTKFKKGEEGNLYKKDKEGKYYVWNKKKNDGEGDWDNVNRTEIDGWDELNLCNDKDQCLGKKDLNLDSKKSLIALTEAPNQSLISWASTIYNPIGSRKQMKQIGYHSDEKWMSVLFQVMYIGLILVKSDIYFENMNFKDNFYVRDLNLEAQRVGQDQHWVYKIDDIEFFVPNMGHLVVFDTKYKYPKNISTNIPIFGSKKVRKIGSDGTI